MASESFNISRIDESPLDTKEMDTSLSRSSSATTTQGSSSLPSAGPCIDNNTLRPTSSIQDNNANQEAFDLTDAHLSDESQSSRNHDNTASNHDNEGLEQLREEDQQEILTAPAPAPEEEEEEKEDDKPLASTVTSDAQEPSPAAVLSEEEGNPEHPDVLSTIRVLTGEEEDGDDQSNGHNLQQQLWHGEGDDQICSSPHLQEFHDREAAGLDDGSEEHDRAAMPFDMRELNNISGCAEEDVSSGIDGDAFPYCVHGGDDTGPTPSSSSRELPDSTNAIQEDSENDGEHASGSSDERNHQAPSLPRVSIDEPESVADHSSPQQGDGSVHSSQLHPHYEDHVRDDGSEHTVMESRRVWEADRHAAECRRCNRRFNFLVRRHHCRRCGLVVCDRCSGHRIRLPPDEIIQDPAIDPAHYPLIAIHPQRVCDVCVRLPIKEVSPSSGVHRRATIPVSMKRSGSSQSLMSECPVCGHDLLGMPKKDQEKHLQLCLTAGSPPVRPPRYLGKGLVRPSYALVNS
ncbi:hypothetical protein BX666DRAFT_1913567 [Dichotomocladium elegans]|nr:hypothetical protein BX666DRAFT_1913567 [Dichotomocladium elegans]